MAVTIDVKPAVTKKMRDLAEKVLKKGPLTKAALKQVAQHAREQQTVASKEFFRFMREKSGMTDEQLLKEIQPYLSLRGNQIQNHPDVPKDYINVKILLAWRLQQRGLTREQIGTQLGVSAQTVGAYLVAAREHMRVDPQKIDIPQQIGETLAFYQDVREMALMLASSGSNSGQKLQAMSIALSTERDKNDFLTKVGVYSPSVIQSFQQVVMNSMTVMMGGPTAAAPETGVERFMQSLARDLVATAQERTRRAHTFDGELSSATGT